MFSSDVDIRREAAKDLASNVPGAAIKSFITKNNEGTATLVDLRLASLDVVSLSGLGVECKAISAEFRIVDEGFVAKAPKLDSWGGKVDYRNLPEPRNVGPDKPFTRTQHDRILEHNKKMNKGVLKDDVDGSTLNQPTQSKKGVKADMNQAEVDHGNPRKPKDKTKSPGTNSNSNAVVRSKQNNIKKSNN